VNRFKLTIALAALTWLGTAAAQVLPRVQVPPLPDVRTALPAEPLRAVAGSVALPRVQRADALYRDHRAELDHDNRGELVVRAEVVAIDITDSALAAAKKAGFDARRTQELPDLGVKITVLQTPDGMSATRALKKLRKLDPTGTYDYNHVYLDSGGVLAAAATAAAATPAIADGPRRRIGLIDGGVDPAHEALSHDVVHAFGCEGKLIPNPHGLAVASVLAAHIPLEIYAADVYCGAPTGGAVDAVAAAFGWLARERVAVINVSLVGPRNALLERIVASLVQRGFAIVAAVGNDGPAAPPLYPASYDGVVGVTAVDKHERVLVEAGRGAQVDFAAQGADRDGATQAPAGWAPVRGTSFASPVVAELLAEKLDAPDVAARERALTELAASATDLGKSGRDDVYGAGLVGAAPSK